MYGMQLVAASHYARRLFHESRFNSCHRIIAMHSSCRRLLTRSGDWCLQWNAATKHEFELWFHCHGTRHLWVKLAVMEKGALIVIPHTAKKQIQLNAFRIVFSSMRHCGKIERKKKYESSSLCLNHPLWGQCDGIRSERWNVNAP